MTAIVLSVLLSTCSHLLLKSFERFRVNTAHAVVMNYVVCVATANLLCPGAPLSHAFWSQPWFPLALLLGGLLIGSFYLMGTAAQRVGLATTSVASKVSLVIPVSVSVVAYDESLSILRVVGLACALLAAYLATRPGVGVGHEHRSGSVFFPLAIFLSSGVLDALTKYVEATVLRRGEMDCFLVVAFAAALAIGLLALVVSRAVRGLRLAPRSIAGGTALGCTNYGAIHFLARALGAQTVPSSMVFPTSSISVLVLTTLGACVIFGERLSRTKLLGIAVASGAVILIGLP